MILLMQKYKMFIYLAIAIASVSLFVYFKKHYFNEGYEQAKQELNIEYTKKLEENIKKSDLLVKNSLDLLSENKKLFNTTSIEYQKRIQEANKIIQDQNFKCKINKEQVLKLNELTRRPK